MKVKGRSENVIELCREVEHRLPRHPLFDNFRKDLKQLEKKTKSRLVVTVINDLPDERRFVAYNQLLSQMMGYEVGTSVIRSNIYLNYSPTLDFNVTFPSGEKYSYNQDKRRLLQMFLPQYLQRGSLSEYLSHIWKKYQAEEDFYPLLSAILSLDTPAPGNHIEILSPNAIENVTLLFPLGNDPDSGDSYWKNFLNGENENNSKNNPIQRSTDKIVAPTQRTVEVQKTNQGIAAEDENAAPKNTAKSTTEKAQVDVAHGEQMSDLEGDEHAAKGSTPLKNQTQTGSSPTSDQAPTAPKEYASPSISKTKFVSALEEANAFIVLSWIDDLLTHNFLGILGRSHPLLRKNTIVILEGDSHGLPGQQVNDMLSFSLGTSSPLWMYYKSGDPESYAVELRSFVNSSTPKMDQVYIVGVACTLLEGAAKSLKKMILLLTQKKTEALSDNITPLDDYFNYYFSQSRFNDLIRKRSKEFKEDFPNEKPRLMEYVSERINASITSDELMNVLDNPRVRQLAEYQYLVSHQFYLERQRNLRDNFNLQLARLYSEFESNYHLEPLELELPFDKEDPIYRYKVSFDIFERMLNVLMKQTSDLEQVKAHMMNSVLAKFQEDYVELENYYTYHFRKSMLIMEQGVEQIRKEYHKLYRKSIDQKSKAFIKKINALQGELESINDLLDMLNHSPIHHS